MFRAKLFFKRNLSTKKTEVTEIGEFGDFSYVKIPYKKKLMEDAVTKCDKFNIWDEFRNQKFCVCSHIPTSPIIFDFEKILRSNHPLATKTDMNDIRCMLKTIADHGWEYFDAVGIKNCDYGNLD